MSIIKHIIRKVIISLKSNCLPSNNGISQLRRDSLTQISQDFVFGTGSMFHIGGRFKNIIINANVITRNYCLVYVHKDAELIIHANVFFNNFCSINCLNYIEIGENTLFGESVKLYDHNHKHNYTELQLKIARNEFTTAPIKIGKNCWIGSNVTILKGVSIGDNCIIGSGCLIYKSIPNNSIVKHKEELIIDSK